MTATPISRARTLIAVRTHRADTASLAAFDRYAQVTGARVVFACDERAAPVDTGGRPKAAYDLPRLARMGLFAHPKCGWRCGDYNYYILREDFPDFDQYWLIEPDVLINVAHIDSFFAAFAADEADFLAAGFGTRNTNWGWHAQVKDDYPEVYGCLFPVTRISGRAIDYLYEARRRTTGGRDSDRWPNDEAFAASALMAGGFACADLNGPDRLVRTNVSIRITAAHDAAYLAAQGPDGLIYHPVRDVATLIENASNRLEAHRIAGASPTAMRNHLPWLVGFSETCLTSDTYHAAALVPITLARQPVSQLDPEAEGEAAAQAAQEGKLRWPESRYVQANHAAAALHRQNFGPSPSARPVGTVHVAVPRAGVAALSTARADDFQLGPGYRISNFPLRFALPFAFDMEAKALLLTLHVCPRLLLQDPFLYAAQRTRTQVIARVPWLNLGRVFGPADPVASPIFILSFGRTGSTLLGKLIGCVTPRSFLEPDTVTQLASFRGKLLELTAPERNRLVWSSVAAFFHTYIENDNGGRCVIKLRSQASGLAAELSEVFPRARFVFMLRERAAWAQSTYRAFRVTPENAVGRLLHGLKALQLLSKDKRDLAVISYEEMVENPAMAVERLMGIDLAADSALRTRIDAVMQQDSQANAAVSRVKTSRVAPEETDWLAAFEAQWKTRKPAALMEELGINI